MQQNLQILNTWSLNARAWINTIANDNIESRRLVTNKAITDTIISFGPIEILDLGCGEGWLIKALKEKMPGSKFTGVDAIPELIEAAKRSNPFASFHVHSYESIIKCEYIPIQKFDVIAINFALFGNEVVADLLLAILPFLDSGGRLVIQTLHPHNAGTDEPYEDGWRKGSWNGFSDDFKSPAPWYFRTLQSWISLFRISGYSIDKIIEPVHPLSKKPASVIFCLSV
jgi:trans-aconitate methyltransferase